MEGMTMETEVVERTFEAKVDNLHEVLGFLEEQLELHEASMKIITTMSISIEEMYANVCMYAYSGQEQPGNCTFRIWFEGDVLNMELEDSGLPFNPLAKQDPDIHLAAEDRGIGGLGIYMVKEYMDSCEYRRENSHNIFKMRKAIR